MTNILRKFPNDPVAPDIEKGEGPYLYLKNGTKYLDATAGWTSYATLGFCHPKILSAMHKQMQKFTHIDFNVWNNPMIEELANKLIKYATNGLDKVYFGGTSGSDAIDAAMKLSYQIHCDSGNSQKKNYITRVQSFNGATLHAMSASDLPILKIYDPLLPLNITKVSQHNPYTECKFNTKENNCVCGKKPIQCMGKFKDETIEEYVNRGVKEIESEILRIGSDKICAFVGETQLGSLVGDVPAAKGYWKKIGDLAEKYNFHIILDEVYCGMGRSGKLFNYTWDDFSPDFVCVGKNMTSGHTPLSAVVTKSKFQDIIAKGSGRIQLGHTFQGYSLGIAACNALIDVLEEEKILERINLKGEYMRKILQKELGENPFFKNIRGRGFSFALEHSTDNNQLFGINLQKTMKDDHNIIINSKWHRTSFIPPYILNDSQIDLLLEKFILTFKNTQKNWSQIKKSFDIGSVSKSMGAVKTNN